MRVDTLWTSKKNQMDVLECLEGRRDGAKGERTNDAMN
jgi:hypothetical protein